MKGVDKSHLLLTTYLVILCPVSLTSRWTRVAGPDIVWLDPSVTATNNNHGLASWFRNNPVRILHLNLYMTTSELKIVCITSYCGVCSTFALWRGNLAAMTVVCCYNLLVPKSIILLSLSLVLNLILGSFA